MSSSGAPAMTLADCQLRLRAVTPAELTDVQLREQLVQLEQVRSAADAAQARLMLEMTRRHAVEDAELSVATAGRTDDVAEFVLDEIAVTLRCTKMAASYRYTTAFEVHRHVKLAQAWRDGLIDGRKAGEIASAVSAIDQPGTVGALAVDPLIASAVEYGRTHTMPQLRSWLRRHVIDAAPDIAERRRQQAREDRRVVFTPTTDGMAELWALLPAESALHIKKLVDAAAISQGRDDGDRRTADQRRADVFVDLVTGQASAPNIDLSVVVSTEVLEGCSDASGELVGYGPITAAHVTEIVGGKNGDVSHVSGISRVMVTDEETGGLLEVVEPRYRPSRRLDEAIRLRDLVCRFPGCRRNAVGGASGVDLDHTVPWPAGDTSAANLAALCRHHHRLKHRAGWKLSSRPDGALAWTTPTGATFVTRPWKYLDRAGGADPPPD